MKMDLVWLFTIVFLIGLAILSVQGCAHSYPLKSICVVDKETGMCWQDKKKGVGFYLKDIDGYYCVSESDLVRMTNQLILCEDQPQK